MRSDQGFGPRRRCIWLAVLWLVMLSLVMVAFGGCASNKGTAKADVNGHRLAYSLQGGQGPVIVLEAGLGDDQTVWAGVTDGLAQCGRVFAYDRPGYGDSASVRTPRDAAHIAGELREDLQALGLEPPYVLVGHSLGGLSMQYFARNYPQDTAGLVLVESSHADQTQRVKKEAPTASAMIGVASVFFMGTMREEFARVKDSEDQVRASPPLPRSMPLLVFTGLSRPLPERGAWLDVWKSLQVDLASQSDHALHVLLHTSGHYVQRDDPKEIIAKMCSMVRELDRDTADTPIHDRRAPSSHSFRTKSRGGGLP